MTTITVGQGGLATIGAALNLAQANDIIIVRPGVYREKLSINKPGLILEGEPGAEINGGWNGKLVSGYANQVSAVAPGVVIRGLTIRNCPGRGIAALADGVQVIGNRIDNTYHGGMIAGNAAGAPISGLLIEGNVLTRMSQSWVTERQPSGVNGSFNILNVRDSMIRSNILSDGWGEGINIGRGSQRVMVTGNTVHSMNHVLLYFNHCIDCEARGNTLYHIPDPLYGSRENEYSAGVVFGDERSINEKFTPQRGNRLIGNVIVGAGKLLMIRNGSNPDRGYDTQLNGHVIRGNTFVAGPGTSQGIDIEENQLRRPHMASSFTDNVIHFDNAQAGAMLAHFAGPGVEFAGNAWSAEPPAAMRGAGDIVGDLALAAPYVLIERTAEPPHTSLSLDDYRPAPDSPLVRPDGQIGALPPLEPPPPPPPPDPEEPPVEPPPDPPNGWRMELTQKQRGLLKQARRIARAGEYVQGLNYMQLIDRMADILDSHERNS